MRIHCRFCGRFLAEKILKRHFFCSPECRMRYQAGEPSQAGRRHAIKAILGAGLGAGLGYLTLGDAVWRLRFDEGFAAEDWTDADGKAAVFKRAAGYAIPEALSLFQPSAGLLNGHLQFDVRVGRAVGFAVRAQSYQRPAYYSVGLRNTGRRLRPLELVISEVHRNRAKTIRRVELDTLSSLNRSQMRCAVSLAGDQIAAYVDGKLVYTWRDRIGQGSGAVGLIPPEGADSRIVEGVLVARNVRREQIEDQAYLWMRQARQTFSS